MNTIEKLRAEIERRLTLASPYEGDYVDGQRSAYRILLSFLDTLESEIPNNHLEGLDDAAREYIEPLSVGEIRVEPFTQIRKAFKAGAEWAFGQFESVGTFPVEDAKGGYWPTEYFIRKK